MIRFARKSLSAGLGGLSLGLLALSAAAAPPAVWPANLPLYFEAAGGPATGPATFIARGHDYQFLISPVEAQIALRKSGGEAATVRMQFVGADPQAQIRGDTELPGKINYLNSNDPAHWRVGVAMFARVRVGELYPGVNLVYYGNQQLLEYDFDIAPGTDPGVIALRFDGTDKISVNRRGELILRVAGGEIRQPRPVIYQLAGGARKEIEGGYRVVDAHTVAFAIGRYDHNLPLIIDPVLGFSTYFGGTAGDAGWAVTLDTDGFIYITGETFSPKLFTNGWTIGPAFASYSANYHGGKFTGDAFVAKFANDGHTIYYLTYLGGSSNDRATAIALDGLNNVYVTGYTDSTNFPTTTNAFRRSINGTLDTTLGFYPVDAFVAELDSSGSNLIYSTFLGGSAGDGGTGIAVDSLGNAFVTGFTYSTNFPTTNAFQKHLACTNSFYVNANAFITKIGAGGSPLVYSTYFGGTNFDQGQSIAVSPDGFVYVAGFTGSTNFPNKNAFQKYLNGTTNKSSRGFDAFVAKFDATGTNLVYSTFLGGTNNDAATAIALDANGAAYVTGWTISTNFPNTVTNIAALHSFVVTNTSHSFFATNVFLTKITNAVGTTNVGIAWSTVFGGKGADVGYGVAVEQAGGDVFVAGSASSTNFPAYNVPGLMSATNSGKNDAFVIAFANTTGTDAGTNLLYSGYLGGSGNDYGYGIAVDANTNAFVVGQTLSTNFPSFNGTVTSRNGTNDAFLTKIYLNVLAPEISDEPVSQTNAVGSNFVLFINGTPNDIYPPYFFQWQKDGTNLVDGTNAANGGSIISGATNLNLFINNAQTSDSGTYRLIITNYGGSVTSSNALLGVTNVLPAITQPISQTNGAGTAAIFAVTATNGSPPLHYQWQEEDTNSVSGWTNLVNAGRISGATSNVLTISSVQTNNDGTYRIIVTNIAGSVTSSNATLTVLTFPEIFVQPPTNQSMAVGATATFAVEAKGAITLHYQWRLNGVDVKNVTNHISGATTNVLIISNVQITNKGTYTVFITNSVGSVTSSNAFLDVTNVSPAITQPISQTNGAGTTAIFTVFATNGTPPLHYQWQEEDTNSVSGWTNLVNGGRISGATSNVLTISSVQTNDDGTYRIVVTNIADSVTSSNATLTVLTFPEIIVQPPTNQTMAVGATATLAVEARGAVTLHYQWKVDGTNVKDVTNHISGANTNVLIISNVQITNKGTYTVVITNSVGSVTSSNSFLDVTNIPVTITVQPQPTNLVVSTGSNLTLTVTAAGTSPLNYQWQFNGTNLVDSGPTQGDVATIKHSNTRTLSIENAQTNISGNYTVVVTNVENAVTSSVVTLTVAAFPLITEQPTNQTVAAESAVTFAVTAFGTPLLRYQWQLNGLNLANGGGISGVTSRLLTIGNVQTTNSGTYTVVITNSLGSVISSNAVLLVTNVPASIIVQPQPTNLLVAAGSNVSLTVTATGTAPLSYQWQFSGTNLINSGIGGPISGVTNRTLKVNNAQISDNGDYQVIVSNPANSVTSSVVTLTVLELPSITEQPTNQLIVAGSNATLAVTAIGAPPLSYQWQFNGGDISGATNRLLTLSNVQTNNDGNYTVIITNNFGSVTSSNAVLTVITSPFIIVPPANQVTAPGYTATFTVTAIGTQPLSYQWWFNDTTQLVDGGNVSGSTNSVLTINNVQTNNLGAYSVVVTNSFGSVTSSPASLSLVRLMVVAWGDDGNGQTNVPVAATNVAAIAGGAFASLALRTNGTVVAWGDDTYGQIDVPVDLTNAVAVAGGGYHSLALRANGTVAAWGNDDYGQTDVPASLTNAVAIGAGNFHNLALRPDSTVVAWGLPDYSQTNIAATLTNVTAIAAGGFHSLALLANNTVVSWGADDYGQTNVPAGLTNVVAIAGGGYHSLALRANGTVVAWGDNTYGQTNVPANLTNVVAIAGGGFHSLAIKANGAVVAWGTNTTGQLDVPADLTNVVAIAGGLRHSLALENDGSPFIVRQPASRTALTNTTVTFTVAALGAPALSYQWRKNSSNLTDGGNVSGSTNATLTLAGVQTTDAAGYTVVITNAIGSVTSSNAVLTVTDIPPDFIPLGFGNITAAGEGSFILSGTGGVNNGTYYVLASSNLLAPLTNWAIVATNQFDGAGNFIFTNAAQTNAPQEFYLLKLP